MAGRPAKTLGRPTFTAVGCGNRTLESSLLPLLLPLLLLLYVHAATCERERNDASQSRVRWCLTRRLDDAMFELRLGAVRVVLGLLSRLASVTVSECHRVH